MKESTASRPCLLVIEDNPADVQLLRFALEDAGLVCDLLVIEDGLRALSWVRLQAGNEDAPLPDAVVLDLNLPKHDGVEILEHMRDVMKLQKLPVLVLTSSPSPRDVARTTAFPKTRYLLKPPILDEYVRVTDAIREMLAESGARRESRVPGG